MNTSASTLLKKAPATTIRYTNPAILCRRPQLSNDVSEQRGSRSFVDLAKQNTVRPAHVTPRCKHFHSLKRVCICPNTSPEECDSVNA